MLGGSKWTRKDYVSSDTVSRETVRILNTTHSPSVDDGICGEGKFLILISMKFLVNYLKSRLCTCLPREKYKAISEKECVFQCGRPIIMSNRRRM